MYQAFYGLRARPFSIQPDPGFLYLGRTHSAASALLEYSVARRPGFVVITGEIGTGKTTLIRHLVGRVPRDISVGLLSSTHPRLGELLPRVLHAFGLEAAGGAPVQMLHALECFLDDEARAGRRTLLVIDEAHGLSADTLEELRMLTNLGGEGQMMQVVLAGQPGLRQTLRGPALEQLAQRVVSDYHLDPLSREETRAYILHRLQRAGGRDGVFEDAALEAVHGYSGGVPRLINILCEDALIYAALNQIPGIGEEVIHDMAEDRLRNAILPLAGRAA